MPDIKKRPKHVTRFRVIGTQSDARGATVVYDETILSKRPAEALNFAEDEIGRRFLDDATGIWCSTELACIDPKGDKHKRFIGSEKFVMMAKRRLEQLLLAKTAAGYEN